MMELSLIMLCEKGLSTIARLEDGRRPLVKECVGGLYEVEKDSLRQSGLIHCFWPIETHLELLTMRNVR